jgi:ribonucleotide monophosphatase NagD (HAD superfamily)
VAALEYASGRQAEIVGKPAPGIVLEALRFLSSSKEETLLVGDALELDIVAGHRAGVTSALVLSGLTSQEQAESAVGDAKPDLIVSDVATLLIACQAG